MEDKIQMSEMISVIIPTYNRAHVISEAIQSVLDQTYRDFELLVIDDGSTDDTQDVVSRFSDKRIKYHYIEHKGRAYARNYGLQKMCGRYVAFLDSDDLYGKEKLKSLSDYLRSHPETMIAYSSYTLIQNGIETFQYTNNGSGNLFLKIFKKSFINMNTTLIRRECIDVAGGFKEDLRILEDYDFYLRLSEKFKFSFVNVMSSYYRKSVDDTQEIEDYILYTKLIKKFYEQFQMLKDNPRVYRWKYGKALNGLGMAYLRANRYDEALRYFRKSLRYRRHPGIIWLLIKNRHKFKAKRVSGDSLPI